LKRFSLVLGVLAVLASIAFFVANRDKPRSKDILLVSYSDPSQSAAGQTALGRSASLDAQNRNLTKNGEVSAEVIARVQQEMRREDQQYELEVGIRLPQQYEGTRDLGLLRAQVERGDRYAAARLGQLLIESGDTTGGVAAYETAVELGLVAPLAELAMLFEDAPNSSREFLRQSFGHAPQPDMQRAYVAANVAYLRGYQDAYHVLDRVRRSVPSDQRAAYDRQMLIEHIRLMELYRQRFGRYPSVQVSSAERMRYLQIMQANFTPKND
jgi:hypothetical protein